MNDKAKEQQQEIKDIVRANLERVSPKAILHIGGYGSFTREEILEEVDNDTDIGKKMIEAELEYLKLVKEGKIYDQTLSY